MAKKRQPIHPDAPLLHTDHPRPSTRREFIKQGFMTGGAAITTGTLFGTMMNQAHALLQTDISDLGTANNCPVGGSGNMRLPFLCFDLAGGANFAGSNVVVGGPGGQADARSVSAAGYSRLGIPGDRLPDPSTPGTFTNNSLGLEFHSESALLAGMLASMSTDAQARTNGAIIPARSDNDTGNNPHNPMYGIAQAHADGGLLTLIGSQATESGGRSIAAGGMDPMTANIYINPELRPTKIDRPSDALGLVDTGELLSVLSQTDATRVMEAVARISDDHISKISTGLSASEELALKQRLRCAYIKSAFNADKYSDPQVLNPESDSRIVDDAAGIFTTAEFNGDREFRKTSTVMKLVVDTEAGAGCVTMGGYDYHTGNRIAGEQRDFRAGRCIGAALEYAHRVGRPLMVYAFSDGSVFSNGNPDDTDLLDGAGNILLPGGKGQWTGDNSGGASSLIFVYNPSAAAARPTIRNDEIATRQQLGYFRSNGSVETSARTPGGFPIQAANNVTSLVETVLLNYIALHEADTDNPDATNTVTLFNTLFPRHSLGSDAALEELIIFNGLSSMTDAVDDDDPNGRPYRVIT